MARRECGPFIVARSESAMDLASPSASGLLILTDFGPALLDCFRLPSLLVDGRGAGGVGIEQWIIVEGAQKEQNLNSSVSRRQTERLWWYCILPVYIFLPIGGL